MFADEPDFSAKQHREFAADGESKSGAAVLAGGSGIRLLESFKNQTLLLRRNSYAGV